jgi:hypothetical protein
MGQGPKTIEGLELTPEQRRDRDKEWILNPKTGDARPKPEPSVDLQAPAKQVRIAHKYTD